MESTLENLAAPLREEKERLVQQRKKLTGDFNQVRERYVAKLEQIDSRLETLEDALGVLLGSKGKKLRSKKRPGAPPEEVKGVLEMLRSEQPGLIGEELFKGVEQRLKAKGYSCSGLKQRVKKLLAECSAGPTPNREDNHERQS